MDLHLRITSSAAWLETVLNDFDSFLLDHASCEKKASGMALSLISHYPDKPELLREMLNLAVEELNHYRDVMRLILERGLTPGADSRDPYVNGLHRAMDRGKEAYLQDQLLIASIIEARGAERFGLIADALPAGKLKQFYQAISDSESRHYQTFLNLAEKLFEKNQLESRLQELLDIEKQVLLSLPPRPALH